MNRDQRRSTLSVSVAQAVETLEGTLRDRAAEQSPTFPTGFSILDEILGGGLRAGELILLGGPPGVGKTICALQWARNIAASGRKAVFACYEHEPATLLSRLLALEAGQIGVDRAVRRSVDELLATTGPSGRGLRETLEATELGTRALRSMERYADNLILVRASGSHTDLDALREVVEPLAEPEARPALFVDYLQKIPIHPEPATEAEKVRRTVEAMKDLALDFNIPVVMTSAVDAAGLQASRLRMFHLRGSTAVAFEADVVLMLNDKHKAVSKVHLSYDALRARSFREWIVMSIEKNRGGPNLIDLEFRKDFAHFRLDPDGGIVAERLVSEHLDEEMA
jgi:replicative DNA helicase